MLCRGYDGCCIFCLNCERGSAYDRCISWLHSFVLVSEDVMVMSSA